MEIVCLGLMVCDILVKTITKDIPDRDSVRIDFVKMNSGVWGERYIKRLNGD